MFASKRLGKELQKAKQKLPPGITLHKADDFSEWQMDIRVLDGNPIYHNQIYRLSFIFSNQYPIEAPEVSFIYVPPSPEDKNTISPPSNNLANGGTREAPIDLDGPFTTSTSTSRPHPTTPQTQTQQPPPPPPTEPTHRPIPMHPHVYSNGIICLDLLGTAGWSPVQSVESVCMSLQSMLTGNTRNIRPEGDEAFCQSMGVRGPKGWNAGGRGVGKGFGLAGGGGQKGLRDVRFAYDDDTV